MTRSIVGLVALLTIVLLISAWTGPKSAGTKATYYIIRAADVDTTIFVGRTHISITQATSTSPCVIRPTGGAFTAGSDTIMFPSTWEWAGGQIDSIQCR